jgi:hypothetical protein
VTPAADLDIGTSDPTPITAVLRLGERRLCAQFPPGSVRIEPGKLTAGSTARPTSCVEPAAAAD